MAFNVDVDKFVILSEKKMCNENNFLECAHTFTELISELSSFINMRRYSVLLQDASIFNNLIQIT